MPDTGMLLVTGLVLLSCLPSFGCGDGRGEAPACTPPVPVATEPPVDSVAGLPGVTNLACGRSSGLPGEFLGERRAERRQGLGDGGRQRDHGIHYLGGNGLLLSGRCKSIDGGFTAVSGDVATIDQDWESILGPPMQPTEITASPQGTVVALTDGIRDTFAGGNSDCFIAATGTP